MTPAPTPSAPEPLPVLEFFGPDIIAAHDDRVTYMPFATMDCAHARCREQAREVVRRCNAHDGLVAALAAILFADDALEAANDFETWADYPKPCFEQIHEHDAAQNLWFAAKEQARSALAAARPGEAVLPAHRVEDCDQMKTFALYALTSGKWYLHAWGVRHEDVVDRLSDLLEDNSAEGVKAEPTPEHLLTLSDFTPAI